jgi:hypothetical protein
MGVWRIIRKQFLNLRSVSAPRKLVGNTFMPFAGLMVLFVLVVDIENSGLQRIDFTAVGDVMFRPR